MGCKSARDHLAAMMGCDGTKTNTIEVYDKTHTNKKTNTLSCPRAVEFGSDPVTGESTLNVSKSEVYIKTVGGFSHGRVFGHWFFCERIILPVQPWKVESHLVVHKSQCGGIADGGPRAVSDNRTDVEGPFEGGRGDSPRLR